MKKRLSSADAIIRLALTKLDISLVLSADETALEPVGARDGLALEDAAAETSVLGKPEAKALAKHFAKTGTAQRREALAALLNWPHAIQDTVLGWRLFLLCLLTTFADLVVGITPIPLIILTGLTTAPQALRLIVESFSPFRKLTGKAGSVKRPICLEASTEIGALTVSNNLCDYLGGKLKTFWYGKLPLWIPVTLMPMAISVNAPESVVSQLLRCSPFALLIFCGVRKLKTDHVQQQWDGTPLQTVDLEVLQKLSNTLQTAQAIIRCFDGYVRCKSKHWRRVQEGMTDFYPVAHVGKYTRVLDSDPDVLLWATALSVLRQFLRFAERAKWICHEEAEATLLDAWAAVLPESSPLPPSDTTAAVRWDAKVVFEDFLTDYIRSGLLRIARTPRSDPEAIAELHHFDNMPYLILPRSHVTAAYSAYLDTHGGAPVPGSDPGITLAHQMLEAWGLPIRTEGNDITWRYSFYPKGQAPKRGKDKIPCLAIPLSALSEELQMLVTNGSDSAPGGGDPPPAGGKRTEATQTGELDLNA